MFLAKTNFQFSVPTCKTDGKSKTDKKINQIQNGHVSSKHCTVSITVLERKGYFRVVLFVRTVVTYCDGFMLPTKNTVFVCLDALNEILTFDKIRHS